MVGIQVLGPLAAEVGDGSADLGGPRQRAVLALLLTARGETLSADRMIEDLWGNAAPPRALASLQAYVSNLRRALEPGRSPRTPARLLVSAPPGYALRVGEEAVDAWRFEASVRRADALLASDPAAARAALDGALALWRGEAYAEFADAAWAATETTRLAELRLTARELQAAATLRLGHAAEASLAAETLTRGQPLREEGWRLLALSLWAADRRADALAALRRAREVLADELGLDPGPGLRELESAILRGEEGVLAREAGPTGEQPTTGVRSAEPVTEAETAPSGPEDSRPAAPAPIAAAIATARGFVGREAELAAVARAAAEARAGVAQVVLVSGEAGAGKTSLLARAAAELGGAGWVVATGRCPETDGAPPAYAWEEVVGAVAAHAAPDQLWAADLAPLLRVGWSAGAADRDAAAAEPSSPGSQAGDAAGPGARGSASSGGRGRVGRAGHQAADGGQAAAGHWHAANRRPSESPRSADGHQPATRHPGSADHQPATGHPAPATRAFSADPHPAPATRAFSADPQPATGHPDLAGRTSPGGPPATDRFRLHRAVCAWLAAVAADQPLAVVLDDLHRADGETLALLAAVAEEVTDRPLLLIAAYRPEEGDLTAVHARLARRTPLRLPLGGLAQGDAVRLVRTVAGVPAEAAEALAERAAGNPFFLLESARMVADAGAYVPGDVPEGVRDVLRRRFERLQAPALAVLRLLAVAGREADAEVLLRAADADEDTVLDALDAGVEAGLLTEPADGRVRFTHALVRDTLHADLTRLRRARMHTRIAAALRELRPDDVSALAHHYLQAPSADTARPAVEYALRAADLAGRRYAHDAAAGLLARAARCLAEHPAAFPGDDVPARIVDVLGRLLRAQTRGGRVTDARATRARAMDVAEEYGRQDLLIEALTAWTEPTVWENRDYGSPDTRPADALHRLLARDDLPPATRCRLLDALASALDADGAGAAHDAAVEAVRLARTLGEPVLLAQALATLSRVSEWEFEQGPREELAAELAELAAAHDLPAYGFVAEYVATGSAAFRGDLTTMRRHMARGREIAETHRLSDSAAIVLVQQAALEMAAGRLDEAERGYGEAIRQMRANGALHTDGLETIVGFSLLWLRGRAAEGLPLLRAAQKQYGPLVGDALAISLVAAGDEAAAREARAERPPIRRDFFYSLFLAIRAHAALDLREHDEAEELLEQLHPVRHQMIGAGSVALALRPVALTMAELALLLDRPAEARGHYERAVEVARSWESPWWEDVAREELARLTDG